MAKKKTKAKFDLSKEYSPDGVLIRDSGGVLTRKFRVRHPEEAKIDDDNRS